MIAIEAAGTAWKRSWSQPLPQAGLDSPQVAMRILERCFPIRWSEPASRTGGRNAEARAREATVEASIVVDDD
jgi:hypothetical protein